MNRCYFCKKIVWFWQDQYLGITPAHSKCDAENFDKLLCKEIAAGRMTLHDAANQRMLRWTIAYDKTTRIIFGGSRSSKSEFLDDPKKRILWLQQF